MVWLSLTTNMLLGLLFARAYGESHWNWAYSVIQTSDGGYALAGYTEYPSAGGYDVLVVKLNASGAVQWAKTYGGTGNDNVYSIVNTTDGGYAVAGTSWSFGSGSGADFFLFKLSSDGSLQWAKAYDWSNDAYAYSVIQTSDGGYALAGKTFSSTRYDEYLVVKTGTDGALQWARIYGWSAGYEAGRSIAQLSDGSYIIAGDAYNMGSSIADTGVLLVKASSDGTLQWHRGYYNSDRTYLAYSLAISLPGDYVIGGIAPDPGTGRPDFFALMVNPDATLDWAKTIGGTQHDSAFSVFRASDGGYVFAGVTNSYGAGYLDFMVVKLSASGNLQWARTFGSASYNDAAYSVIQMSDGTFAVAGRTAGYGAGGQDAFILKLSSTGIYTDCVQTCSPTVATPSLSSWSWGSFTSIQSYPTVRTPSPTVQNVNLSTEDACPTSDISEGFTRPAPEITCFSVHGGLIFSSETDADLMVFSPDGRLACSCQIEKGETHLRLEPGVYLWIAGNCRGKAAVR